MNGLGPVVEGLARRQHAGRPVLDRFVGIAGPAHHLDLFGAEGHQHRRRLAWQDEGGQAAGPVGPGGGRGVDARQPVRRHGPGIRTAGDPARQPQHQARNDFDIFADIADRLGYRDVFTEGRNEMQWIEHLYQQCAVAHARRDIPFPEFGEFWERGFVEIPEGGKPFVFMDDFRANPETHPIQTASGKIELFSQTIADYQLEDFAGHPEWREPQEWLGAPLSSQFPLHMISIQPSDRLHSQMDATATVQGNKTAGHETLYMHPQDAAARDIQDGDEIEVSNARGRMLAGVRLTDGVTPGVVIIATGAWFDPGFGRAWQPWDRAGNPNVLTLDIGTSSLTQGPNAMSCLVEIKKHLM